MKIVLKSSEKGAALLPVLSLIAVMSILLGISINMWSSSYGLAQRYHHEIQSEFMLESALNELGDAKLKEPKQFFDLPISEFTRYFENPKSGYYFDVNDFGMGAHAHIEGWSILREKHSESQEVFLYKQKQAQELPTLVVMDSSAGVSLGLGSSISGKMALWEGRIGYNSRYKTRYTGRRNHTGILDSNSYKFFKSIIPEKSQKWRFTECPQGWNIVESLNSDSLNSKVCLQSSGRLRLSDVKCENCLIQAKAIELGSNNELIGGLVKAEKIKVKGGSRYANDFWAKDSMNITAIGEQVESSNWMVGSFEKDSTCTTWLEVKNFVGKSNFYQLGCKENRERTVLMENVNLKGWIYVEGALDVSGRITGGLWVNALETLYQGTLWRNLLLNVNLKSFENSDSAVRLPLFMDIGKLESYEIR